MLNLLLALGGLRRLSILVIHPVPTQSWLRAGVGQGERGQAWGGGQPYSLPLPASHTHSCAHTHRLSLLLPSLPLSFPPLSCLLFPFSSFISWISFHLCCPSLPFSLFSLSFPSSLPSPDDYSLSNGASVHSPPLTRDYTFK